jgi:hypothetical protein
LASTRGSIWSYEDLPQWRPTRFGSQAFDIDLRGDIGVSYIGTDNLYWYALKTDTGWADIQIPLNALPFQPAPTTLDTTGAPIITAQVGDAYLLARLLDSAWVTETIMTGMSEWENTFICYALGSRPDGAIWGVFTYTYHWPPTCIIVTSLYGFQVRDSQVSVVQFASGTQGGPGRASGCADAQGAVHSCYDYDLRPAGLYLDTTVIDTVRAERTAVKFDSLDRPQIAYVLSSGGLLYRYLDAGGWHIFDLRTTGVTALSLIIGENSQPLIAYTTSDGVFLAHGVDVVGQSEEQQRPAAIGRQLTASVIRNALLLPEASSLKSQAASWLLDASGRRALVLHPGMNDVGRLRPGVYFVREAQSRAVRKVIITR